MGPDLMALRERHCGWCYLPCSRARLPTRLHRAQAKALSAPGAPRVIRDFGTDEFSFLVLAARWTILLAAVAFLGCGIAGAVVARLRVLPRRRMPIAGPNL